MNISSFATRFARRRTKVIFVCMSDMESTFSDVLARRVIPRGLKYTVDELIFYAEKVRHEEMESITKKKKKHR